MNCILVVVLLIVFSHENCSAGEMIAVGDTMIMHELHRRTYGWIALMKVVLQLNELHYCVKGGPIKITEASIPEFFFCKHQVEI
jgi:hypothetical protein